RWSPVVEAERAVEAAAEPAIEWLRQTDAVPGLLHLGAAGERVAGAINIFGKRVRLGQLRLALEVAAHRLHVRGGLARVDVAQRIVGRRLARPRLCRGRRSRARGGAGSRRSLRRRATARSGR